MSMSSQQDTSTGHIDPGSITGELLQLVERMLYMLDGGGSPSLSERDQWIADAEAVVDHITLETTHGY